MSYQRVLPRDLFNEAKLLKCVGKIALLVEDGMIPGLSMIQECSDGFKIKQDEASGSIMISNLRFVAEDGEEVYLYTSLNSKEAWPLVMAYDDSEYYPINEDGEFQLWDGLFKRKVTK